MGVVVSVVRVFTDRSGEFGNLLGIVAAADVPPNERQSVAEQLGFSETVFVDAPAGAAVAAVQIFTPATELPFAGHPTVGLGWWLGENGNPVEALEVPAGRVAVTRSDEITRVRARAEWAPEFVFHDLDSPADVDALDPSAVQDGKHYFWAWSDESAGALRSRMFGPAFGIAEDEATGAAAARITARLERDLTITQGRGSQIFTTWAGDGWVEIGGRTVAEPSLEL